MKRNLLLFSIFLFCTSQIFSQTLPNPILFVTVVPTPNDSSTQAATFGNHLSTMYGAPRGGDLYIRYTDGTLKNLTLMAGLGTAAGQQGANGIAVREPSVHWSGTKALFSMIVGGAAQKGDNTEYYWQIYEITGLNKNDNPVITKISKQPSNFNNVSPIYGTDDRIIFSSDRTINGQKYLFPNFDEYKGQLTNIGLWSLDPSSGDLFMVDHSPSGDFTPIIDSYGKLLFMRWDRLQRDRNADFDALQKFNEGTFNYTNETQNATAQYAVRTESFPEPQGSRTDLLAGTNMNGFEFNSFFPWQINEDGSQAERLNHIGRHEINFQVGPSIKDDPNVVLSKYDVSGRKNQNYATTFMQVKESPQVQGKYYGVDAFQSTTHAAGQIYTLDAQATLDPDDAVMTYITHKTTAVPTFEGNTPNASHTGLYRNPLPMTNGTLVVSHTANTFVEKNLGSRNFPVSRYDFRLKTMKQSASLWIPDQNLTNGISKSLTYYDPDSLVSFNGNLWELDAVELVSKTRPQILKWAIPDIETQVFADASVDVYKFQNYMKKNNLALAAGRDVTHRDKTDKQQPYYLKVAGTSHQSKNATGKIYDVSHIQFFQGDHIRGKGMTTASTTPIDGRRVLAVPMHDVKNPPNGNGPEASVKLGNDGSWAAFVHSGRATTWQITSSDGSPVVRERYWVTFKAGEVRACASCHGTNDACLNPKDPPPTNKPQALYDLLQYWRSQTLSDTIALNSPSNNSNSKKTDPLTYKWNADTKASSYNLQISSDSLFKTLILDSANLKVTAFNNTVNLNNVRYFWRVKGINEYGDGYWSNVWAFNISNINDPLSVNLALPLDKSKGLYPDSLNLSWTGSGNITNYIVTVATKSDMSSLVGTYTVNNTNYNLLNLKGGVTYYWQVQANSTGGSALSQIWSFTTGTRVKNSNVNLINPENIAFNVDYSPAFFNWNKVKDAANYNIQIADNSNFGIVLYETNVIDTFMNYSLLNFETLYYWRVRAENPTDTGNWSPTFRFRTKNQPTVPNPPALFEPSNNVKNLGITGVIKWLKSDLATDYKFELAEDTNFTIKVKDTMTTGLQYNYYNLPYLKDYFWRVTGKNSIGLGNSSETWHFTTIIDLSVDYNNDGINLSLYPVPVSEYLTINFNQNILNKINIDLFNPAGQLVKHFENENTIGTEVIINISDLPVGIYTTLINFDGKYKVARISVVR